jgi:hypothetical protein
MFFLKSAEIGTHELINRAEIGHIRMLLDRLTSGRKAHAACFGTLAAGDHRPGVFPPAAGY